MSYEEIDGLPSTLADIEAVSQTLPQSRAAHKQHHRVVHGALKALKSLLETNTETIQRVVDRPRSPMQATYGGAFTAANVMAALAGGAAVDLPVGTCVGSIAVPGGSTLRGVPGKTILKPAPGAATNVLSNADAGGFVVEGVLIDGNKAALTSGGDAVGNGLYLANCSKVIFRHSKVINTRRCGVQTASANDIEISDNDFEDCGDAASLALSYLQTAVSVRGHRTRVVGNRIRGTANQGIGTNLTALGQLSGLVIADNMILNSRRFGIALGSFASDVDIDNNYIDGVTETDFSVGGNAIDTGACSQVRVTNNTCLNATADGIDCDASSIASTIHDLGLVISGNRIRNMGRWGIVVLAPATTCTGVVVAANHIDTVQLQGITMENIWRSTVSNNIVRNNNENAAEGFASYALAGDSKRNTFAGNIAFEDRVTKHTYGYSETGANVDYITLIGNDFSGCYVSIAPVASANDIRIGNR